MGKGCRPEEVARSAPLGDAVAGREGEDPPYPAFHDASGHTVGRRAGEENGERTARRRMRVRRKTLHYAAVGASVSSSSTVARRFAPTSNRIVPVRPRPTITATARAMPAPVDASGFAGLAR